jgi:outer membrane murein-binding lipoprotein Lpp
MTRLMSAEIYEALGQTERAALLRSIDDLPTEAEDLRCQIDELNDELKAVKGQLAAAENIMHGCARRCERRWSKWTEAA